MTQLNQIIAIEKGVKAAAKRSETDVYHNIQSAPRLGGIARTYHPKDDEGDQLPPESTLVQVRVEEQIDSFKKDLVRLFDVVLTKDGANTLASADVKVGDKVLLRKVPVTYLLFLHKELVDLKTFISKLPVLDPAESWTYDATAGVYRNVTAGTTRTKKVLHNHVKAEATKEHPAQVDTYAEDVIVGTWSTTKFSGALPADRVTVLNERVVELIAAVEFAREEANGMQVTDLKAGEAILGHLFAE